MTEQPQVRIGKLMPNWMINLTDRIMQYYIDRYLNCEPVILDRPPEPQPGHQYLLYAHIPFCKTLCSYCTFHRFLFKEHKAREYFVNLRKEMDYVKALGYDFTSMYIGGGTTTIIEEELIQMFYFRFQETPLLERAGAVMEHFADAYETLHQRDLTEEELEFLQQKFDSLYVTKDLYEIYNWLLEDLGLPLLPEVPLEKRIISYEDVYPLLYLKYRLRRKASHKRIKHLVIDEMQDYSYLQYVIIENLFSCRMTILGDRAQALSDRPQDVTSFLPGIFGKRLRRIDLQKSYRNTVEIARYAQRISGEMDLDLLERHGREVEEKTFPSEDALLAAVGDRLRLEGEHGFETAAVLTLTQEEAYDIYRLLKLKGIPASYVDRDSTSFAPGLTVTTFYLAKGLEFDQVFSLCGDKKNPLWKQARYIAATRALQELYVYETEEDA